MKNSADLGGCYPQRPKAEVDSSYPTQPHSIIAKYLFCVSNGFWNDSFSRETASKVFLTSKTKRVNLKSLLSR